MAVKIETLTVMAGAANGRNIAEAIEWARENKLLLAARWLMYSEGE